MTGPKSTRILLVQNGLYLPAHGGANKVNRAIVEGLAAKNHTCRAVVRAHTIHGSNSPLPLLDALSLRGIAPELVTGDAVVFRLNGVEVHAVTDGSKLRERVMDQMNDFCPGWTLVASEDPGQVLLKACLPRAIYLAQTTLMLPFGPGTFANFDRGVSYIKSARGVVSFSRYIQDYLRRWGGIESSFIPPPIFRAGPFPRLGRFTGNYITIVNPCAVKGIGIFIELARALRQFEFAAVCGWGTTKADREALTQLPNVHLLEPVDDIREVLEQTRVLLVPSLWAEAFGCIVVEAMQYGIPVLASNVGGLPEAKLGVDYLLPVNPIEQYQMRFDDRLLPMPIIPAQDCEPWIEALTEILSSEERFNEVADQSFAAAQAADLQGGITAFENYLQALETRVAASAL
jgi:glycosyltransferase involved in cell wall biosynthesis